MALRVFIVGTVDWIIGRADVAFVCPEREEKRKTHLNENTKPKIAQLTAIQQYVRWLETQDRFEESWLTETRSTFCAGWNDKTKPLKSLRQRVGFLRVSGRLVTFFLIPAHAIQSRKMTAGTSGSVSDLVPTCEGQKYRTFVAPSKHPNRRLQTASYRNSSRHFPRRIRFLNH